MSLVYTVGPGSTYSQITSNDSLASMDWHIASVPVSNDKGFQYHSHQQMKYKVLHSSLLIASVRIKSKKYQMHY